MDFIKVTTSAGQTLVDVYNIALVLPKDKTVIELYKGENLEVSESVNAIDDLLAEAKKNAL